MESEVLRVKHDTISINLNHALAVYFDCWCLTLTVSNNCYVTLHDTKAIEKN